VGYKPVTDGNGGESPWERARTRSPKSPARDREVEAKGRVEQKAADPSKPVDDVTEKKVEEETEEVRKDHLDIPPER
jgi:hypothetical protein